LALLYIRVSTSGQVDHGVSLDAQEAALTAEAKRRGWDFELVMDKGFSAKNMNRPGLQRALAKLDAGTADHLMAVRLDRISRSVSDFAATLDRSARKGWGLVLLTPDLDTTSASGKFLAHVLASASEYERALISDRTREALARKKVVLAAKGERLGRPKTMPDAVVERIVRERAAGRSLRAIAEGLNHDQVPTAQGGKAWYGSSIKAVLDVAGQ
jgi:DNA invertase Pin-like site-specific DNA recombinase